VTRHARPDGLARRIAQVRRQFGLTQGVYAQRIGVSRGTVGEYEAGRLAPRARTLGRMAQVGRVTTDWLLYGDRPLRRMMVQRGAAWAAAVALLRTAWRDPERRAVTVAVLRAVLPALTLRRRPA
jgi:transcriptional regulator with XRE-family HTH domain